MTAASLAGFFLTLKNAILTLKGKACQGEKVEVRNAFSNGERFGGGLGSHGERLSPRPPSLAVGFSVEVDKPTTN